MCRGRVVGRDRALGRSPKALYFFKPGSYRFRDDDIDSLFHLGGDPDDHLGGIDFFGGSIFCAVERVGGRRECLVVTPLPDVPVTTKESNQELEGICFGAVKINGHEARIHVALLENHTAAKDNVVIKPYGSPHPDTI